MRDVPLASVPDPGGPEFPRGRSWCPRWTILRFRAVKTGTPLYQKAKGILNILKETKRYEVVDGNIDV